ncbi:unnamed protein product [Linum tenue]|uniref:Uncharacterized protein n=1 Tax=Linum tenue TaxID=586396 RepID=A0AAV0GVI1_9ROSI|nr:unnamed protein product [Linum tenue]
MTQMVIDDHQSEDYYSSVQKYLLEEPAQVDDDHHLDEEVYDSQRLNCLIQSLEAEINYGHDLDLQQQQQQQQQPSGHVVEGHETGPDYGDLGFIISWNDQIEMGFSDSFFLDGFSADNRMMKRD